MTKWPSDWMTEWSSDGMTEWPSDWMTEWPSDWMTKLLGDRMTGSFADDWPYGIFLVVSVHCPLSSLFRMQSRQCLSWETWIWIWYSSDIPFKLELGLGWDQRSQSGQCRNTRRLGEGTTVKNIFRDISSAYAKLTSILLAHRQWYTHFSLGSGSLESRYK